MSARQTATPQEARWIGAIAAAAGLYFVLVGLGLLPIPGGPRNLHAPLWVVLLAGLAFLLGGIAIVIQAIGRADATGELPTNAPHWIRIVQYLIRRCDLRLVRHDRKLDRDRRRCETILRQCPDVWRFNQCDDRAQRIRARRDHLLARDDRICGLGRAQAVPHRERRKS